MQILVNQRYMLKTRLAEAGLDEKAETVALRGTRIFITTMSPEERMVHFCRAYWSADGLCRRSVDRFDELRKGIVIRFDCHVPGNGHYTVDARCGYDASIDAFVLCITSFQQEDELPEDFQWELEDVTRADSFLNEPEEVCA